MSYAYQQNNVVPDSYYETAEDAESLFLGMDLDMAIYLLRAEDWSRDDFRALTNALAKYDNGNYQEPRNHDSWTPSVWANHLLLAGKVIDACRFLRDDEYCRGELPTTLYVYAIIRLATAHMCGIRLRHYVRTEYEVPEPVVESPRTESSTIITPTETITTTTTLLLLVLPFPTATSPPLPAEALTPPQPPAPRSSALLTPAPAGAPESLATEPQVHLQTPLAPLPHPTPFLSPPPPAQ